MKIVFDDINGNEITISKDVESGNLDLFLMGSDQTESWFTFRNSKQLQKFIKALNQIQEEEA